MQYGRYEIVKELGRGSMGVVYQAHDPRIDRAVALKVLRPDRVDSEALVRRFVKEAKAAGRLSHPSIVVVYDIGEDHGTVYISMEYLEGRPLNDVLKGRRLTIEQALRIAIQVCDALDYAHRKGIVHRDIKPSNIILQPDGSVKITDFGIARIEDPHATQQTQAGEILGTPAYMSPEQVLGQSVDGRSDLFSLGVILYELTVGRRPFSGESLATMLHGITHDEPPEPRELNPALPGDLSRLILQSLAKDPRQRFATGGALSEAIRGCLDRVMADSGPLPSPVLQKHPRTIPVPLVLVTLAVAFGLAAGSFFLLGSGSKDSQPPSDPGIQQSEPRESSLPSAHRQDLPLERAAQPPADASPSRASPAPSGSGEAWAALGSLKLESTPAGAEVSIGGAPRGLTPMEVQLPPGGYEVRLSLAGHGDWEAHVKVVPSRVTRIPAELMRIP
ncbi:MAG: protein kinase [Syntrophobacteraceae bacterium]|jgi:serine/threonine-protein kinase|nr:protein kinase [Syntrophobacteraceae bacterium]